MNTHPLLEQLRELEVSLHRSEVRGDAARLEDLLHESFFEFGRSGRSYTRTEILRDLASEQRPAAVQSRGFVLERLADDLALLRYQSAQVDRDGRRSRHANRVSLWQRVDGRWTIRFHQATPTDAFAADDA